MSWNFGTYGFHSAVEFDPPLVTLENAEYGTKVGANGVIVKDYSNMIKPAVKGTERVCQEYIDQLVDYTPATKTHLSSHLLVRARIKEDLECLKEADDHAVFFEDLAADYQYRCIISRKAYANFMAAEIMKIDYNSHVKETMDRRAPEIPGGRYKVLSSIWTLVSDWQPNPPYGFVAYTSKYPKAGGSGVTSTYYPAKKDKGEVKPLSGWADAATYYAGTKYGVKSDEDDTDLDTPSDTWEGIALDDWLDSDFNLGEEPTDLQLHIAESGASFDTMRMQLKDIIADASLQNTIDLDNAVDALIDAYGTCDIDTITMTNIFAVVFDTIPEEALPKVSSPVEV